MKTLIKTLVVGLGLLVLLVIALAESGVGRGEFLAFSRQRDAWHDRCDRYHRDGGIIPANFRGNDRLAASECVRDLEALLATARAHGWAK